MINSNKEFLIKLKLLSNEIFTIDEIYNVEEINLYINEIIIYIENRFNINDIKYKNINLFEFSLNLEFEIYLLLKQFGNNISTDKVFEIIEKLKIFFPKEYDDLDNVNFARLLVKYFHLLLNKYNISIIDYIDIKIEDINEYISKSFQNYWFAVEEDVCDSTKNLITELKKYNISKIFNNGSDYCDQDLAGEIIQNLSKLKKKLI